MIFREEDFLRKVERPKEELAKVLATAGLVRNYVLIYGTDLGEDETGVI